MIECPICHVMNEDLAHFCSECGQRFNQPQAASPAPPPGLPTYPPPELPPQRPATSAANAGPFGFNRPPEQQPPSLPEPQHELPLKPKPVLRSPLLGGDDDGWQKFDEPAPNPPGKPKGGLRSPLLGDDDEPVARPPQSPGAKPKASHLRSPLLGGDDVDDEPAPSSIKPKRGGLRSPLLSGDDEDEPPAAAPGRGKGGGLRSPLLRGDDEDEPRAPKGKGGLRSPLLRGDDDDDTERTPFPHRTKNPASQEEWGPRPYPPKGGLRSPLLGGADDDFEDTPAPRNRASGSTGGRQRLHSPVLGGGGDYDDYEEEDSYTEDDPNVLRSPLLAAKQKLPVEKPPAPKPAPPQAPAPAPPAPQMRAPEPQQQIQQQQQYGWGQQPSPPDPYNLQPGSTPAGAPAPQNWPGVQGDFGRTSTASPAPRSPESYADTPAKPIPALQQQGTPRAAEPPPAAPAPARGRSRSLATDDEPRSARSSSYDDAPRTLRSGPSLVLLVPCVIALIVRGAYLMDVFKMSNLTATYIADQVAQTVVIICLIIFAMSANKKL